MIHYVSVKNRKAKYEYTEVNNADGVGVCDNNTDTVQFSFDLEWNNYPNRTALFVWGGKYYAEEFTGNTCTVPIISDTNEFYVGVYVGEPAEGAEIISTTKAIIPIVPSIRSYAKAPHDGTGENYTNQAKGYAQEAKDAVKRAEDVADEAVQDAVEAASGEIARILGEIAIVQETGTSTTKVMSQKAVTDLFVTKKVYDEWISGEYVKSGSGAIVKDSSMKRTDYIDISNNRDGVLIEGTTAIYSGSYCWWYTSEKTPLQQVKDFGLGKNIIPPTNAKYLIISCDVNDDVKVVTTSTYSFSEIEKSINEKLDKNQGVSNAGKMLIVGEDGGIVCSESAGDQSSLINKEVENGLNQALRGKKVDNSNSKVLSLSVFTDIHADAENLARYITFCNHYKSKISDKLCLGDMVANQYSDDFTYWTNMSGSSDILRAIGNHDAWATAFSNGGNVPKADAYNKFFADNIASWGVTQPSSASANGLMYYYKDYTEQNVRLIVLDCMYYDNAENDWFVSVLSDAKDKGLHVICAIHHPPSQTIERIDNCNFYSNQYGYSYIASFDSRASANVDTFIGNGGKFVAWLCGDLHWDAFGVINGSNGKQLVLTFECAAAQNSTWYDSNRIKGTISQDSINFVAIDTHANLIKVVRVGNKLDMYLKAKDYFCYDYNSHTLYT